MSILIAVPTNEARKLLAEWERRETQLQVELADLQSGIASIKTKLGDAQPAVTSTAQHAPMDSKKSLIIDLDDARKRKKGANFRLIQRYLEGLNGKGATQAEISQGAAVPMSSVHLVLTSKSEIFAKSHDGFWRLKPTAS